METNEKITTRCERVNAILDTLGDFAERDFSLTFSFGRAYVQLLDGGLSGLAAAHYEPVKTERTDYGTIQREAVIGGVTYTEVGGVMKVLQFYKQYGIISQHKEELVWFIRK